jgi:hypothetical protein
MFFISFRALWKVRIFLRLNSHISWRKNSRQFDLPTFTFIWNVRVPRRHSFPPTNSSHQICHWRLTSSLVVYGVLSRWHGLSESMDMLTLSPLVYSFCSIYHAWKKYGSLFKMNAQNKRSINIIFQRYKIIDQTFLLCVIIALSKTRPAWPLRA